MKVTGEVVRITKWIMFSATVVTERFFFFTQKTADEVLRSLVGSEMCVRDRVLIAKQLFY